MRYLVYETRGTAGGIAAIIFSEAPSYTTIVSYTDTKSKGLANNNMQYTFDANVQCLGSSSAAEPRQCEMQ